MATPEASQTDIPSKAWWYEAVPAQHRDGSANHFGFTIPFLSIGGGSPVDLPNPGVTAIVGSNNVGKSTLLRQIFQTANSDSSAFRGTPRILNEIGNVWCGNPADMIAWLEEHAVVKDNGGLDNTYFHRPNGGVQVRYVAQWRESYKTARNFAGMFINQSNAIDRLTVTTHVQGLANLEDPPAHPMHVFHLDRSKAQIVISLAKQIFGVNLEVDDIAIEHGFRVGSTGMEPPRYGYMTPEYTRSMAVLPKLSDQGDGMRSALGLLMTVVAQQWPVVLIDEPEAFLHPPQAKMLGKALARLATENKVQVILATHDRNLLLGLLEHKDAEVAVLHLNRGPSDEASAQLLASSEVRNLWNDAELRHGNALDGLFSRGVILTEDDQDSTFYAAAIEQYAQKICLDEPLNIHFVALSGKGRMPEISKRLRAMGICVVCSPDLDILDNDRSLRNLFESQGGAWSTVENDYYTATNNLRQAPEGLTPPQIKTLINDSLDEADPTRPLSEEDSQRIRKLLRPVNPWNRLKSEGYRAMGDLSAATRLLDKLDEVGIVTVRIGALESFLRDQSVRKSRRWLNVALDAGAHTQHDAEEHVRRLLAAMGIDT